jgi:ABC-type maltose transport system permease subunit
MKKILGITIKALLGLILVVLIILFTVPLIFKEKIKTKVETVINESVNAKVTFADYKLSFFRNFPNLAFSMKDMYVVGIDKFNGDTLAGFKSFDLVFNLGSVFF